MSTQLQGPAPPAGSAPPPAAKRIRLARVIAVVADALQIAFIPAFAGGVLAPLNDALDVVVALLMMYLVGWHFAFLPTLVAELIPGLGLIPTWTAAVWFVTRRKASGPR